MSISDYVVICYTWLKVEGEPDRLIDIQLSGLSSIEYQTDMTYEERAELLDSTDKTKRHEFVKYDKVSL